ncbi:MAG: hypothetical protein J6I46_15190 [Ruminococcus sp.]|nr:hypothetical protein [Ruminococcus sp.]
MKHFKKIHIASNALALLLLTVFLVWTICTLSDLPKKFGMHYGMDGNFDIYSENKIMAFYPFFAGYGLFFIFSLLSFAASKIKKVGGKYKENETEGIRIVIRFMCDMMKLCWAVFYAFWSFHVIHQSRWHFIINRNFTIVLTLALPLYATIAADQIRKHKLIKQEKS